MRNTAQMLQTQTLWSYRSPSVQVHLQKVTLPALAYWTLAYAVASFLLQRGLCLPGRVHLHTSPICLQVYATLTGMLLVSAAGVSLAQVVSLGTWMPAIGFMACMFFLLSTQPLSKNLNRRYAS